MTRAQDSELVRKDTASHLEELYYLIMGIQYPLTPLLITETSPLSAEQKLGD